MPILWKTIFIEREYEKAYWYRLWILRRVKFSSFFSQLVCASILWKSWSLLCYGPSINDFGNLWWLLRLNWGDKGREGFKKLENWGDAIYGWSLTVIYKLMKKSKRLKFGKNIYLHEVQELYSIFWFRLGLYSLPSHGIESQIDKDTYTVSTLIRYTEFYYESVYA